MCQLWGCGGAGRNCGALCLYRWRYWGGIKKIRIRSSKFQIENQMPKCRKGAVLNEGPKWCGKTTTAKQISGSILYMADPEKEKQNLTIEEMEAWNPNLRAKTAIRTSNTRYFVDPSIAVAALGLGPRDLIEDLNTFGLFFETMCIRDLRVFADALKGKVYYFRDKTGLECDAMVHLRNGSYWCGRLCIQKTGKIKSIR